MHYLLRYMYTPTINHRPNTNLIPKPNRKGPALTLFPQTNHFTEINDRLVPQPLRLLNLSAQLFPKVLNYESVSFINNLSSLRHVSCCCFCCVKRLKRGKQLQSLQCVNIAPGLFVRMTFHQLKHAMNAVCLFGILSTGIPVLRRL